MPILPEECSLYPPDLLDAMEDQPADRVWWAVYTKARQEKALARELVRLDIPFYLPLIAKTAIRAGRRQRSLIPLFQGYLFLFGSDEQRHRSLTTNRISRILPVEAQDQFTYDMRQVRKLIEVGAPLTVESRLAPGRRVRIKSGAMMGLEGIVESRRGADRILVNVKFIQQSVSMEIHDYTVEPLD